MSEAEAGLVIPIGFTERAAAQAMARIEAQAIKAAKSAEKAFVEKNAGIVKSFKDAADSADIFASEMEKLQAKFNPVYAASKKYEESLNELNRAHLLGVINSKQYESALENLNRELLAPSSKIIQENAGVTRSFTQMSKQSRAQIQNVSYQLQDVFVQIAGGQGATRALSQQMPQLLGGFGALGAVFGTVAALAIPLAGSFFTTSEKAKDFEDRLKDLRGTIETYRDAISGAALTHAELTEKYAGATEEAKQFLQVLREIAGERANSTAASEAQGIAGMFGGFGVGMDRAYTDLTEYQATVERVKRELGLAQGEAVQFVAALSRLSNADSPKEYAVALSNITDLMNSITVVGEEQEARFKEVREQVAKIGDQMAGLVDATSDAAGESDNLAAAMAGVRAEVEAINSAIRGLASAIASLDVSNVGKSAQLAALKAGKSASEAEIEGKLATRREELNQAFSRDNANITGVERDLVKYESELREDAELSAAIDAITDARKKAAQGGGRKKSGGGKGRRRKETTEADIFEIAARDIENIERQITLLGKSSEETARLRAEWAMLDAAKKAGIPINDALNAQIGAQAEQVGRLTAELEAAEIAQGQFEAAIDGIANAFAATLVEGESLREGLAQVFRGIAADILNAGIRSALVAAFGGSQAGSGLLRGFVSAAFGGSQAALPSFDGGGRTGSGSRSGGLDGRGGFLGLLHPNETVLDHTRGQSAAGGRVDVRVYMDDGGSWQAQVERISGNVVARAAPQLLGQSVDATRRSMGKSKRGWGI